MDSLTCIHNILTAGIFALFCLICFLVNQCCGDAQKIFCTCVFSETSCNDLFRGKHRLRDDGRDSESEVLGHEMFISEGPSGGLTKAERIEPREVLEEETGKIEPKQKISSEELVEQKRKRDERKEAADEKEIDKKLTVIEDVGYGQSDTSSNPEQYVKIEVKSNDPTLPSKVYIFPKEEFTSNKARDLVNIRFKKLKSDSEDQLIHITTKPIGADNEDQSVEVRNKSPELSEKYFTPAERSVSYYDPTQPYVSPQKSPQNVVGTPIKVRLKAHPGDVEEQTFILPPGHHHPKKLAGHSSQRQSPIKIKLDPNAVQEQSTVIQPPGRPSSPIKIHVKPLKTNESGGVTPNRAKSGFESLKNWQPEPTHVSVHLKDDKAGIPDQIITVESVSDETMSDEPEIVVGLQENYKDAVLPEILITVISADEAQESGYLEPDGTISQTVTKQSIKDQEIPKKISPVYPKKLDSKTEEQPFVDYTIESSEPSSESSKAVAKQPIKDQKIPKKISPVYPKTEPFVDYTTESSEPSRGSMPSSELSKTVAKQPIKDQEIPKKISPEEQPFVDYATESSEPSRSSMPSSESSKRFIGSDTCPNGYTVGSDGKMYCVSCGQILESDDSNYPCCVCSETESICSRVVLINYECPNIKGKQKNIIQTQDAKNQSEKIVASRAVACNICPDSKCKNIMEGYALVCGDERSVGARAVSTQVMPDIINKSVITAQAQDKTYSAQGRVSQVTHSSEDSDEIVEHTIRVKVKVRDDDSHKYISPTANKISIKGPQHKEDKCELCANKSTSSGTSSTSSRHLRLHEQIRHNIEKEGSSYSGQLDDTHYEKTAKASKKSGSAPTSRRRNYYQPCKQNSSPCKRTCSRKNSSEGMSSVNRGTPNLSSQDGSGRSSKPNSPNEDSSRRRIIQPSKSRCGSASCVSEEFIPSDEDITKLYTKYSDSSNYSCSCDDINRLYEKYAPSEHKCPYYTSISPFVSRCTSSSSDKNITKAWQVSIENYPKEHQTTSMEVVLNSSKKKISNKRRHESAPEVQPPPDDEEYIPKKRRKIDDNSKSVGFKNLSDKASCKNIICKTLGKAEICDNDTCDVICEEKLQNKKVSCMACKKFSDQENAIDSTTKCSACIKISQKDSDNKRTKKLFNNISYLEIKPLVVKTKRKKYKICIGGRSLERRSSSNIQPLKNLVRFKAGRPTSNSVKTVRVSSKITISSYCNGSLESLTDSEYTKATINPFVRIRIQKSTSYASDLLKTCPKDCTSALMAGESVLKYVERLRRNKIIPYPTCYESWSVRKPSQTSTVQSIEDKTPSSPEVTKGSSELEDNEEQEEKTDKLEETEEESSKVDEETDELPNNETKLEEESEGTDTLLENAVKLLEENDETAKIEEGSDKTDKIEEESDETNKLEEESEETDKLVEGSEGTEKIEEEIKDTNNPEEDLMKYFSDAPSTSAGPDYGQFRPYKGSPSSGSSTKSPTKCLCREIPDFSTVLQSVQPPDSEAPPKRTYSRDRDKNTSKKPANCNKKCTRYEPDDEQN